VGCRWRAVWSVAWCGEGIRSNYAKSSAKTFVCRLYFSHFSLVNFFKNLRFFIFINDIFVIAALLRWKKISHDLYKKMGTEIIK
jgi:hypothetical protein